MENKQVASDILEALTQCTFLNELDRKTILITGATGMIGSMLIKLLQTYNRQNQTHIHIVAHVRNLDKAKTLLAEYIDSNLEWVVGDICQPINYSQSIDYIIHCASATTSKYFVDQPVETIHTALSGTDNILIFAKEKQAQKVIYTSSLEAYGIPDTFEVDEQCNGRIDWTNVRSSYSEGKRMTECICRSYFAEYGIPVVIARLAQTFGAGFAADDNRVYAQFSRAAANGTDIVLHTQGNTVRNYCYLTDAAVALLLLVARGDAGEVYNVANEDTTCSIAEMAQLAAGLSDGKTKVRFEIADVQKLGYAPEVKIKLKSKKLQALGWNPQNSLTTMFTKTINGLKA